MGSRFDLTARSPPGIAAPGIFGPLDSKFNHLAVSKSCLNQELCGRIVAAVVHWIAILKLHRMTSRYLFNQDRARCRFAQSASSFGKLATSIALPQWSASWAFRNRLLYPLALLRSHKSATCWQGNAKPDPDEALQTEFGRKMVAGKYIPG